MIEPIDAAPMELALKNMLATENWLTGGRQLGQANLLSLGVFLFQMKSRKKLTPDGYVPALAETHKSGHKKGTRVFHSFDPRMFMGESVEAELLAIIRKRIPKVGFGRPPSTVMMLARLDLQKWFVAKLQMQMGQENTSGTSRAEAAEEAPFGP
jgi:hypothetical protein